MAQDSSDPNDLYQRSRGAARSGHAGFEDASLREPMRGPRSLQKEWGVVLIQLRRLLLKNVGRPWDDVYREVCTIVGATHPLRKMLHQRLADLVATDVVEHGGELRRMDPRRQASQPLSSVASPFGLLYVCPTSSRLRRVAPDDAMHRVVLSDREMLRRLGKHWYHLVLQPIGSGDAARSTCFDVVLRRAVDEPSSSLKGKLAHLYGREGVFAASKRQVGKAEVERLRASG
jgi:hypothetical protein